MRMLLVTLCSAVSHHMRMLHPFTSSHFEVLMKAGKVDVITIKMKRL